MAEVQENTQETEVKQRGDKQIVRERTTSASSEETRITVANGIWFLIGALEILLALRFIMKLLGANPASGFVDFIYSISRFFAAPFQGIFSSPTSTSGDVVGSVFESATLVAMLIYLLLGWGLIKLLTLNKRDADV